jgi:hypothetical protein
MIQKHVDLIAIALLLTAISFCAHARNAFVHGIRSSRTVRLTSHYQGSRAVIGTVPHIPFARD